MGGCCSVDTIPDVPKIVQPDPSLNEIINVAVSKYGIFGLLELLHLELFLFFR